jgi:serine/threonine-protein kinase RsbT
MTIESQVVIASEADIVTARQQARLAAADRGFGTIDQSRIATAVSELTRNVIRYATDGKGRMYIRLIEDAIKGSGIEIVVEDDGPGIEDINLALRDGYTSTRSLGLGLPGTKRLMDEMNIESFPGQGTVVTIRKWQRARS